MNGACLIHFLHPVHDEYVRLFTQLVTQMWQPLSNCKHWSFMLYNSCVCSSQLINYIVKERCFLGSIKIWGLQGYGVLECELWR